jgi:hypothetical protein
MAKLILQYQLEAGGKPNAIEDGGYFPSTVAGKNTLIGVSYDDVDNYVPVTGNYSVIPTSSLIARVKAMTIYDPFSGNTVELTLQEKGDLANAWLTERGF